MRSGPDSALYVYILGSLSRVLYTGRTSDLHGRVYQHKSGMLPGFTSRYRVNRLDWFDMHESISAGVDREREIKSWRRSKKVVLIESDNDAWLDLAAGWFGTSPAEVPRLRSG